VTPLPKEVKKMGKVIKNIIDDVEKEKKAKKVNEEIKRLKSLYSKIENRHKKLIDGLIQRAAYMRIQLEEYEADLDNGGYVEDFRQSENVEPYERERPVARLYNTMNKNYQSIIKQLTDLLPKEQPKQESDGFEDFINSRED
jgi:hypothetical protein